MSSFMPCKVIRNGEEEVIFECSSLVMLRTLMSERNRRTFIMDLHGNGQPRRTLGHILLSPLIFMGKFHGLLQEDPSLFISNFLQICNTVKTNGVNPNVYKLVHFPFNVRDRAKQWYKLILKKCSPDMFSDWIKVHVSYEGLSDIAKMSLDSSADGYLHMKKMPEEANELIEMVVNNQYLYSFKRTLMKTGVMEVDAVDALLSQNKLLSQQMILITQHLSGMQGSVANVQHVPPNTSYDMSDGFPQDAVICALSDYRDYRAGMAWRTERKHAKVEGIQEIEGTTKLNGSYNENKHQGWKNQRWEEPQGFDQPSWQQPPPMRYNQQPFYDTYQSNCYGGPSRDNQHPPNYYGREPFRGLCQDDRYGGPPCSYQQAPPYGYELPPQYTFEPPNSQVPYHQTLPYDPDPHPPHQPPHEPHPEPPPQYSPSPYPCQEEPSSYHAPFLQNNEPPYPPQPPLDDNTFGVIHQGQTELHTTLATITSLTSTLQALISYMDQSSTPNSKPSSSSALPFQPQNDLSIPLPPSMEEHPHPSIQEQDDTNDAIDMEQERRDHLRDAMNRLHAALFPEEQEETQKLEIVKTLEDEGVDEGSCHGKVIIKEEYDFMLKELDKAAIVKEEVVEDLGDAEPPWESQVIEPPSKTIVFDVEEGVQPPRHVMVKDLEEVDQEMEIQEEEAQPPMPLESSKEEIELEESYQEEEVKIEETCKEVEVVRE
ncbi:Retrotransposon gag protein [Arachis hypogaea]|nr:Retrotransposon gag protein [Arachis hypogaea]